MSHYYFENTPHGKQKNGAKLNTKSHYDYICREEKYANMKNREEDLIYSNSGNIPEWADNPGNFWEQAEINRRKDGRAYREIRFGLQEELSLAENVEIIERFVKETGIKNNHAYSYAIHDKAAAFDEKHRNIHCHLMFNESVIEKERPLSAEKYFKRYSENRQGKPTQGYKTTDYFERKDTTVYLRKKWADIVNEKFAEKKLDCRISEKSVPNQREDLIREGKYKEAELLNRTPVPHLGSAYKNPKTMELIRENIKKVYNTDDDPKNATNQEAENVSKLEQNIRMFANDTVMRRIAREIQMERLRLEQEQEDEKARHDAEAIAEEPMVVTVEHVYNNVKDKADNYNQLAENRLKEYKAIKMNVLNSQQEELAAKEKLFNGQYVKNIKDYSETVRNLKRYKDKVVAIAENPNKSEELVKYSKAIHDLTIKRNQLGKIINYYKTSLNGDQKEKYDKILTNIKSENEQRSKDASRIYSEYIKAKKDADKYNKVVDQLKDENKEQILFSDKLPAQLNRKAKINGTESISKMQVMVIKGETYALLSKLPKEKDSSSIEAVKIGDDISHGKVPIYKLELKQNNLKKWNVISISKSVVKNSENNGKESNFKEAFLYKRKLENTVIKRSHPLVEEAIRQKNNIVVAKVSSIAERLTNNNNVKLNGRWQDEEHEKKDQTKIAEQKMYNEWSL